MNRRIYIITITVILLSLLTFMFVKKQNVDYRLGEDKLKLSNQYKRVNFSKLNTKISNFNSEYKKLEFIDWTITQSIKHLNIDKKINSKSYFEIERIVKSNKNTLLYLYQPGCPDCQKFEKSEFLKNYKGVSLNVALYPNFWDSKLLWNDRYKRWTPSVLEYNNGRLIYVKSKFNH